MNTQINSKLELDWKTVENFVIHELWKSVRIICIEFDSGSPDEVELINGFIQYPQICCINTNHIVYSNEVSKLNIMEETKEFKNRITTPQNQKRLGKEYVAAAYDFKKSRKVRKTKSHKSKSRRITPRIPSMISSTIENTPELVMYA